MLQPLAAPLARRLRRTSSTLRRSIGARRVGARSIGAHRGVDALLRGGGAVGARLAAALPVARGKHRREAALVASRRGPALPRGGHPPAPPARSLKRCGRATAEGCVCSGGREPEVVPPVVGAQDAQREHRVDDLGVPPGARSTAVRSTLRPTHSTGLSRAARGAMARPSARCIGRVPQRRARREPRPRSSVDRAAVS